MTSYAEELTKKVFKFYLPRNKVIYNYRPNWLKNPETGKNLEIDIFYPNLKLAIEYQGFHHLTNKQIKKDAIKESIFNQRKIDLVKIIFVYRIVRQAMRLYKRNKIKYKMFNKKVSPEIKRKINFYGNLKEKNCNNPTIKRYYLNTRFEINLDKYKKRQAKEIASNIRLRKAKGFYEKYNLVYPTSI